MNEDLKGKLRGQGRTVFEATRRFEHAKLEMDKAYAASRVAVREKRAAANEKPLNEADTDALADIDPAYCAAAVRHADAKAELEAVKADTECLLAEASLACAEVAAMSRISQ